jgi:hypothetical protein
MPETPATGSTATTQRCDPHPIQGDDRGAGGARLHSIGRPRRAPSECPRSTPPRSTPVKSTVKTPSPTRVWFAIEGAVRRARTEPAQGVLGGSQMNVPGFRRGEVPAT